jgi:hypothetical protein
MKKITTDNYEAFVLDYLEGKLKQADREELQQFILLHPELNVDLDADLPAIEREDLVFDEKQNMQRHTSLREEELLHYLENLLDEKEQQNFKQKLKEDVLLASEFKSLQKTILPKEHETKFGLKNSLRKSEDAFYLNNYVLQYLEGELPPEEQQAFETNLANNAALSAELHLYRNTIVSPDFSLVLENKTSLKKDTLVFSLFRGRAVYSAAAAILLLVLFGFLINYFVSPHFESTQTLPVALNPGQPKPSLANSNQKPGHVTGDADAKREKIVTTWKKSNSTDNRLLSSNTASKSLLASTTGSSLELAIKTEVLPDTLPRVAERSELALTETAPDELIKLEYSHLIPFEEEDVEDQEAPVKNKSKGFWSVATRLAKKANQMGIKVINGNEGENNQYLLSFNAMTIEKK